MIEHIIDGCVCAGKRCPACEQVKCHRAFDRSLLRLDGLQPYCRRMYQERNREKYREQSRVYHEAKREKHNEQMNTYRRNNLEAFAVREANRHARKKSAEGSFTQHEWHNLCAYYDFTCLRCGRQEPDIELTVDHVISLSKGGRNSIENLQPLCRTCNTSKHARAIDYRPYFRR